MAMGQFLENELLNRVLKAFTGEKGLIPLNYCRYFQPLVLENLS